MRQFFTVFGILLATVATGAGAAEQAASPTAAQRTAAQRAMRGEVMIAQGQPERAITELSTAVELDPRSASIRVLRGTAYATNNQWREARADFETALNLEPGIAGALGGLGAIELAEGHTKEGIDLLRRSLDKRDDKKLRRMLIDVYLLVDDYGNALQQMERYSRQNPEDRSMYPMRVDTLVKAGRGSEVSAIAAEVLAEKIGTADGYFLASSLYIGASQFDRAAKLIEEGIDKVPHADLYVQRASLERDPARQRLDLEEALKLERKHMVALLLLVDVTMKLQDYPAALETLDQLDAVMKPAVLPAQLRLRGDILASMGNIAGASRAYSGVREMTKDGATLNSMCWAKATANRMLEEALKDCDAALALLPNCWHCHDSRGLVMLRLKRYDDSIASYDKALSGDPTAGASLFGRGIAKQRAGRTAEGMADIDAAIRLSPDIVEKYRSIGISR